jgi:hypothetical protein
MPFEDVQLSFEDKIIKRRDISTKALSKKSNANLRKKKLSIKTAFLP